MTDCICPLIHQHFYTIELSLLTAFELNDRFNQDTIVCWLSKSYDSKKFSIFLNRTYESNVWIAQI
jgi:hypothetical protein